jgi:predicted glycogen debranching enzyme
MAESREWLVTNGIGGYACGTIAGLLTRHYHGLLIAALKPPLGRTLLVTKLEETVTFVDPLDPSLDLVHELNSDRRSEGSVQPQGYRYLERFHLEGMIPVWTFACAEALLEKRVWMQQGANTTYIQYHLRRSQTPMTLSLKALVNYRNHHNGTIAHNWQMQRELIPGGVEIRAFEEAVPFYLLLDSASGAAPAIVTLASQWQRGYDLAIERYRGIPPFDDHLHIATFSLQLHPGQSFTVMATTDPASDRDSSLALTQRQEYERDLLDRWRNSSNPSSHALGWIQQLVLAADQFVVDRQIPATDQTTDQMGKTVIAGYPWFGDWGRDTMISLPGLAIVTGRADIARPILQTFGRYFDQGMLPNMFPDSGATPTYNTVDATLWYFQALRAYYEATLDLAIVADLFPALQEVITWHQQGTRYGIHLDRDGLIYAGEPGVQLTWMDAKVGDWVVTPRIGKPVEISALWYNALQVMIQFATLLKQPSQPYEELAALTQKGFQRFWNPNLGYCYDVLDGPDGADATLRPNQLFAISLLTAPHRLLTAAQQQSVVNTCARALLTSHGLRSLAPGDRQYQGHYGGDPFQRDGAYHQGTVWGWLIGPFVEAHFKVYGDAMTAQSFLEPLGNHLASGCIGTLSEIFDGNPPMTPRGAFAQAWTVAEVLRVWQLIASTHVTSTHVTSTRVLPEN